VVFFCIVYSKLEISGILNQAGFITKSTPRTYVAPVRCHDPSNNEETSKEENRSSDALPAAGFTNHHQASTPPLHDSPALVPWFTGPTAIEC